MRAVPDAFPMALAPRSGACLCYLGCWPPTTGRRGRSRPTSGPGARTASPAAAWTGLPVCSARALNRKDTSPREGARTPRRVLGVPALPSLTFAFFLELLLFKYWASWT